MYESVFNENKKLKHDETNLCASLQTQTEKYKELQKLYNKVQEDTEGKSIKERLKNYQSEFREIQVELDKAVKAFNIDAEVCMYICMHVFMVYHSYIVHMVFIDCACKSCHLATVCV